MMTPFVKASDAVVVAKRFLDCSVVAAGFNDPITFVTTSQLACFLAGRHFRHAFDFYLFGAQGRPANSGARMREVTAITNSAGAVTSAGESERRVSHAARHQ